MQNPGLDSVGLIPVPTGILCPGTDPWGEKTKPNKPFGEGGREAALGKGRFGQDEISHRAPRGMARNQIIGIQGRKGSYLGNSVLLTHLPPRRTSQMLLSCESRPTDQAAAPAALQHHEDEGTNVFPNTLPGWVGNQRSPHG